ncbi:MAG TPA: hypothetical protein VMN36_18090 [Verrucomicrobiales bacterium]|nr:hypothetical protein [Verrucomicrobiales bacterium]
MSEPRFSGDDGWVTSLLRLKRYEAPEPGYAVDFLERFRERQRAEMLKGSATRLWLERLGTYLDSGLFPRWMVATGAGAALAAMGGLAWWGGQELRGPSMAGGFPSSGVYLDSRAVVPVELQGPFVPFPATDVGQAGSFDHIQLVPPDYVAPDLRPGP